MRADSLAVALVLACGCSGEPSQLGADEPFRVRDNSTKGAAQFVRAKLPGKAPAPSTGLPSAMSDSKGPPQVVAPSSVNGVVVQGQSGKKFTGRTTGNAVAIALALKGVSNGYWLTPLDEIDPQTNQPTWTVLADFDDDVATGYHNLLFSAIDDRSVAGVQSALKVCVVSRVPDNLHACDPTRPLPRAVISLQWDANADLDLQVITPDKRVVDRNTSTTADVGDDGMLPPGTGVLDRDSDASCVIDGIRTENLVWNDAAPSGRFGIYVNMFDACKQPAVRFRVEVYTVATDKNGNEYQKQRFAQGGELLDISANGGSARGLFVTDFNF